jgi:thiol:disulfide interchange protein DsbA
MQSITGWLRFAAAVIFFGIAGSASAQVAGRDFRAITPPQPTETGNKVEVIEFFSYGCPHCQTLESPLAGWLKRKPADVEFRRVPVVFRDDWAPYARLYYTLEAMGLVEKLNREVFAAIHEQRVRLQEPNVLFDWVAAKGVEKQKFTDTYNSFSVQSRTQRSRDLAARYTVDFTPAIVVNGRFLTAPSMTSTTAPVDFDKFFKVVDHLIATSRKTTSSK